MPWQYPICKICGSAAIMTCPVCHEQMCEDCAQKGFPCACPARAAAASQLTFGAKLERLHTCVVVGCRRQNLLPRFAVCERHICFERMLDRYCQNPPLINGGLWLYQNPLEYGAREVVLCYDCLRRRLDEDERDGKLERSVYRWLYPDAFPALKQDPLAAGELTKTLAGLK